MRGCLTVLVLALLAALLGAWVGAPIVARDAVAVALRTSGFTAKSLSIRVSANPPPLLLLGHADRVHIVAGGAAVRGLQADSLDFTLSDVDLASRTFGSVDGTLVGARIAQPAGTTFSAGEVDVAGPTDAALATLQLDAADLRAMLQSAYGDAGRTAPAAVEPVPPSELAVTVAGKREVGRLAIDGGSLVMRVGDLVLRLASPGPDLPLELRTVSVGSGGVVVGGVIDVAALLP